MIKRMTTAVVLLLVLAAIVWYGFFKPPSNSRPGGAHSFGEMAVPVLTSTATQADVPIYLHGLGTIHAYQTVTVKPQVSGQLLSLNFEEGQHVKKGQTLARIDPTQYKADLQQAQAQLGIDQATLANDQADMQRYSKLAANNYVSKQKADQARAAVRKDKARVALDKAAITSAQATLGYTKVLAPITGRTGFLRVDAGNIVSSNDSNGIVAITQLKPISVVFTLPASELGRVRRADTRGKVPVRVFDSDNSKSLDSGYLDVINNTVDADTGTIKLKARLPNNDEQLWPGQFVNVRLKIGTLSNATVVPSEAVQLGPNGAFVYGIKDDKAHMHAVTVVQQSETRAVIGKGVQPGEQVITAGFAQLSDGATVKVGPADSVESADDDDQAS